LISFVCIKLPPIPLSIRRHSKPIPLPLYSHWINTNMSSIFSFTSPAGAAAAAAATPSSSSSSKRSDKHYANTRARRDHTVIVSSSSHGHGHGRGHGHKKRKKDTSSLSSDTESVSSVEDKDKDKDKDKDNEKDTPKAQCPLRPYFHMMIEPVTEAEEGSEAHSNDEEVEEANSKTKTKPAVLKTAKCPLRRVKLSHTLLLCLFISVNLCLVNGTLFVMGLCRCAWAAWVWWQSRLPSRGASTGVAIVTQKKTVGEPVEKREERGKLGEENNIKLPVEEVD